MNHALAEREANDNVEQYRDMIQGHSQERLNIGIAIVKTRGKGIQKAKADEVSRWEPKRLNDELQSAKLLLELASKAPNEGDAFMGNSPSRISRFEQLYNDTLNSGDMYKARAVAEVMTSYHGFKAALLTRT